VGQTTKRITTTLEGTVLAASIPLRYTFLFKEEMVSTLNEWKPDVEAKVTKGSLKMLLSSGSDQAVIVTGTVGVGN